MSRNGNKTSLIEQLNKVRIETPTKAFFAFIQAKVFIREHLDTIQA